MLRRSTLLIACALLLAFTAAMLAGVCLTAVESCVASIAILRVNNSSGFKCYNPAACSRSVKIKSSGARRTEQEDRWDGTLVHLQFIRGGSPTCMHAAPLLKGNYG